MILEAVDQHAGWRFFRYKNCHLSIECRNHFSHYLMRQGVQQRATMAVPVSVDRAREIE